MDGGSAPMNGDASCSRPARRPASSRSAAWVNPVPTLPANSRPAGLTLPTSSDPGKLAPVAAARQPAADQHVGGADVADLEPVRRPAPGQVRRGRPLDDSL